MLEGSSYKEYGQSRLRFACRKVKPVYLTKNDIDTEN